METMSANLRWLLLLWFLLSSYLGVRADTPGKLNLYDDYDCNHPSSRNPTVSLSLETCLVHVGCEGLVVRSLPPCPQSSDGNGTASHIFYSDSACGTTVEVPTSPFSDQCYTVYEGTTIPVAKSFMFTCEAPDTNPAPSSTTTAVVSQAAAVASGTNDGNSDSSGTSPTSATATPTAGSTSPTEHSSSHASVSTGNQPTSTSPASTSSPSQSTTSSSPSPSSSPASSGGLGTANIIAIAVGVGIGVPTILLAYLAWRYPKVHKPLRKRLGIWSHSTEGVGEVTSNSSQVQTVSRAPNEDRQMGYNSLNTPDLPYGAYNQNQYFNNQYN